MFCLRECKWLVGVGASGCVWSWFPLCCLLIGSRMQTAQKGLLTFTPLGVWKLLLVYWWHIYIEQHVCILNPKKNRDDIN